MKASNFFAHAAVTVLTLGLASAVALGAPKGKKSAGLGYKNAISSLMSNAPKKATKSKAKRSDCANLEGNWRGTCVDNEGYEYTGHVEVEQNECEDIAFGDFSFPIGGGVNLGMTDPTYMYGGVAFADWNGAGSILRLRVSFTGRELGNDSFFFAGIGNDDYQLVNGQLVYRSISDSTSDVGGQHTQERYWETCTYDKVPDAR